MNDERNLHQIPQEDKADTVQLDHMREGLILKAFHDQASLERWLMCQKVDAPGIWLRLQKKAPGQTFLARQEAIDAALCHGWIDGQALKHDESSYLIRFTPRRPRSIWSQINRERAIHLMSEGRMQPRGIAQIDRAKSDGRWARAYAPASTVQLSNEFQAALKLHPEAASYFKSLKRAARYAVLHALETVKKPETRERRIKAFIIEAAKMRNTD